MGLSFIPTDSDGILTLVDPHVTAEVLEAVSRQLNTPDMMQVL